MTSPGAPLRLRSLVVPNRLWLSPMCMYSSADRGPEIGSATDWHLTHLESRAVGGAGLVMIEATAVHADGRLSVHDLGIWSDVHEEGLARLATAIKRHGSVAAIQLGHAGSKASIEPPWVARHQRLPIDGGGWLPWSPGARADGAPVHELSAHEVAQVPELFAAAARRASRAGFQVVEIHAAHGYLLHSFLSPLTNRRTDRYGADRSLLLREVIGSVRSAWPEGLPVFVRLSAVDWDAEGIALSDTVDVARVVANLGVDLLDISTGGIAPVPITPSPGYQVEFAAAVRSEARVPVAAVGMLDDPRLVASTLATEQADAIFAGRAFLRDPYWARHVLESCGDEAPPWPDPYGWAIGRRP